MIYLWIVVLIFSTIAGFFAYHIGACMMVGTGSLLMGPDIGALCLLTMTTLRRIGFAGGSRLNFFVALGTAGAVALLYLYLLYRIHCRNRALQLGLSAGFNLMSAYMFYRMAEGAAPEWLNGRFGNAWKALNHLMTDSGWVFAAILFLLVLISMAHRYYRFSKAQRAGRYLFGARVPLSSSETQTVRSVPVDPMQGYEENSYGTGVIPGSIHEERDARQNGGMTQDTMFFDMNSVDEGKPFRSEDFIQDSSEGLPVVRDPYRQRELQNLRRQSGHGFPAEGQSRETYQDFAGDHPVHRNPDRRMKKPAQEERIKEAPVEELFFFRKDD